MGFRFNMQGKSTQQKAIVNQRDREEKIRKRESDKRKENMDKRKFRYAILKEIDRGNKKLTEDDFRVSEEDFDEAVRFLDREGYLKGIFYADDRPQFFEGTAYLTEKGESYLDENSGWAKTYKGIKEIREWLKI